jgi:hypothetical protein
MRHLTILVTVWWFAVLFAALLGILMGKASAQTPTPTMYPDVKWTRDGGVYNAKCVAPVDLDMAEICFIRADVTPIIELGCVPAGPSELVSLMLAVTETPGDDAEIRCYAVDLDGYHSDNSPNAGLVDFTRPGRPYVP